MDFFRWRRTILRALLPSLLCGLLAAWGVYVITSGERPNYRSEALLSTGVMTGADADGSYVRDLVINELEGIMNLARSFETREELATRLLATYLALDDFKPSVISRRAYVDFKVKLDPGIIERHSKWPSEQLIYESLVAERDSLRRFGEANAKHPLIQLLYGDNELVGLEHLSRLKVARRGLSDILEISYSTVDAAWCKRTLDTHIEIFLASHAAVKNERSDGALAYFREATSSARSQLERAEERLRAFASENKIINYYEQTRAVAALKSQVDNAHTEEQMRAAAAKEALASLEERLAKRLDLVRLNRLVDDDRREISELSREQVRLEIMAADSNAVAPKALKTLNGRLENLRKKLSQDVLSLQGVYNGPEGLELNRLLSEWLAATIAQEESRGRLQVLDRRKSDFNVIYTDLASQGTTLKKIEREVHIAEEDYLENLRNLNQALQREHSQASSADLRLVDEPMLPTTPVKSRRLLMIAGGLMAGGLFPFLLAVALELLSGAILSFAEAERLSGLSVVGGVARWSWLRQVLRKRTKTKLRSTTADLLWQGIRSRTRHVSQGSEPYFITFTSLRPGAGKTYVLNILAERLAERGLQVLLLGDRPNEFVLRPGISTSSADTLAALSEDTTPWARCGLRQNQWHAFHVILWELPAVATGRLPVDVMRQSHDTLLVHPPSQGWTSTHSGGVGLLTQASGKAPLLVLNGLAADILLNEWGSSWSQLAHDGRKTNPCVAAEPLRSEQVEAEANALPVVSQVPPDTQIPTQADQSPPAHFEQAIEQGDRSGQVADWESALFRS